MRMMDGSHLLPESRRASLNQLWRRTSLGSLHRFDVARWFGRKDEPVQREARFGFLVFSFSGYCLGSAVLPALSPTALVTPSRGRPAW